MTLDPGKFPLSRFVPGDKVVIWRGVDHVDTTSVHGTAGTVRQGRRSAYVEVGGGRRVYDDGETTCFMTEEEFAVFEVMSS